MTEKTSEKSNYILKSRLVIIGALAGAAIFFTATPAFATHYYSGHKWFWGNTDVCYDSYSLALVNIDGGTNKFSTVSSEIEQARTDWNNQPSSWTINKSNSCNHWITAANYGNTGALATTYWQYDGFGYIIDDDTEINDYYAFATAGRCTVPPYTLDYVMRHEFGHWVQFNHAPNSDSSVMHASYDCTYDDSIKSHDSSSLTSVYG